MIVFVYGTLYFTLDNYDCICIQNYTFNHLKIYIVYQDSIEEFKYKIGSKFNWKKIYTRR